MGHNSYKQFTWGDLYDLLGYLFLIVFVKDVGDISYLLLLVFVKDV